MATVGMKNVAGTEGATIKVNTGAGGMVTINGKETKASDLKVGDNLNFYVKEGDFGASPTMAPAPATTVTPKAMPSNNYAPRSGGRTAPAFKMPRRRGSLVLLSKQGLCRNRPEPFFLDSGSTPHVNENDLVIRAWNTVLFEKFVRLKPQGVSALRTTLAPYSTPKGAWAPSSTWHISSRDPE
jgi:hypothetical protein